MNTNIPATWREVRLFLINEKGDRDYRRSRYFLSDEQDNLPNDCYRLYFELSVTYTRIEQSDFTYCATTQTANLPLANPSYHVEFVDDLADSEYVLK